MPRSNRTPKYRRLKQKGRADRAFVEIDGRRHYLGTYGSEASRQRYDLLVGEWLAGGRQFAPQPEQITVAEVLAAFIRHAKAYYDPAGAELANFVLAMKPLKQLYARRLAADFGPRKLKAVQQLMVEQGGARAYVNRRIKRIKHIFKWAKNEELIPPSVYESIRDLPGLKRGRTSAPERDPIPPVPDTSIAAVLPHVSREVAAMIELQRLTGMRPGEVVLMRTGDIDTTGKVWTYIPHHHKTAYRERQRTVYLGPQAQSIAKPWIKKDLQAYLFSPQEAERRRKAAGFPRMKGRKRATSRRANQKPNVKRTTRKVGDHYSPDSYRRAIHYACDAAGIPRWSPNQLRHRAATDIRRAYGLEAAQLLLGHARADVTQIYAERDKDKISQIVLQAG